MRYIALFILECKFNFDQNLIFLCFLFSCVCMCNVYPQLIYYIFIINTKFSILCEPSNFSTDPIPLFEAYLTYFYFLLKLSHYLDTVFFILRKKWSQITFLHVYHHIIASIAAYIGILYVPGLYVCLFSILVWISLIYCTNFFQVVIALSSGL